MLLIVLPSWEPTKDIYSIYGRRWQAAEQHATTTSADGPQHSWNVCSKMKTNAEESLKRLVEIGRDWLSSRDIASTMTQRTMFLACMICGIVYMDCYRLSVR